MEGSESLMMQLQTNHLDVESCLEELRMEGSENFEHQTISPAKINKPKEDKKELQKDENQNKEVEQEKSDSSMKAETNETKSEPNDQVQPTSKFGFMSRFFKGKQQEPTEVKVEEVNKEVENETPEKFENIENIDDFVPDSSTGLDNSFFDEPTSSDNLKSENPLDEESSSSSSDSDSSEGGNPMVQGYDDVSSFEGDDVTSQSSDDGVYDVTENKIVTSQSEVVKDVEDENVAEDVVEEEKLPVDKKLPETVQE